MTAKLLDGKTLADKLKLELAKKIQTLAVKPKLAVILIGEDEASKIYVAHKQEACKEVGIECKLYQFSELIETELLRLINELNTNTEIHGILIQLPLPKDINLHKVYRAISPEKDVDGFSPLQVGLLSQNQPAMRSCTSYGIMRLLEAYKLDPKGKHAVVVGASNLVGKPCAMELLNAGATPTLCHVDTKNLVQHIRQADILISAIGKTGVIQSDWLNPNSIVIDVGINRNHENILQGDIDFNHAKERVAWITPVPGGVGPMTVLSLLENTYHAACKK